MKFSLTIKLVLSTGIVLVWQLWPIWPTNAAWAFSVRAPINRPAVNVSTETVNLDNPTTVEEMVADNAGGTDDTDDAESTVTSEENEESGNEINVTDTAADTKTTADVANEASEAVNNTAETDSNKAENSNSAVDSDSATTRPALVNQGIFQAVKIRAKTLIANATKQLQDLEVRIQASAQLSAETKAKILADIAADRTFLAEQEQVLEQATTLQDIRSIAHKALDHMRERRVRAQEHRAQFQQRLAAQITRAQAIGYRIIERLDATVVKLDSKGVETDEIVELIAQHKQSIAALSTLSAEDPAAFRTAIENLRTELNGIIDAIRAAIEDFIAEK